MTTIIRETRPADPVDLPNERARKVHISWWISGIILAIILATIVNSIINNKNIDLSTVAQYIFFPRILEGVVGTILITVVSFIGALIIGILIGYGRISNNPVIRAATSIYVWFFRSVPLVVLVLIFGNLALFLPRLGVGIPFTSVSFFSFSTNDIMVPFVAGCVAISLEQGAYVAEIVRSGVQSISESQREAAASLGMSPFEIQRNVVLPQAIPVMIPPLGNVLIMLLKSTSLVFAIGGAEILGISEAIASTNFHTMELLFVASIWYLFLTSLASVAQRYLERRFSAYRKRVVGTANTPLAAVEGMEA